MMIWLADKNCCSIGIEISWSLLKAIVNNDSMNTSDLCRLKMTLYCQQKS